MRFKVAYDPTNNSDENNLETLNPNGDVRINVKAPTTIIPGVTKMHNYAPVKTAEVKRQAFIDELRKLI